ncbi:F-box only protein 46 isoform 5-T5 [Theristicus caerulescens]
MVVSPWWLPQCGDPGGGVPVVVSPWWCPHGGCPNVVTLAVASPRWPLAGGALSPGDAGRLARVPARLRAAPAPRPPGTRTRLQPQLRHVRLLGGRSPQQHRHRPLPLVPALAPPSAGRGGGSALRTRREVGDRRDGAALAGPFAVRGPDAGAAAAAAGLAAGAVPPPLHCGLLPLPRRPPPGAAAAPALQASALHPQLHPRQPLPLLRAAGGRHPDAGCAAPAPPAPWPRASPAAAGPAGAPVLFVVPWVVVRYLYENEGCWERNEKAAVWWIIRCPILMAVAVNFVVFVRIVRILVAKVRAHQVSRGDTRVRLARSTLTLIPLLGVHEVAFALVGEGRGGGTLHLVRLCLQLLLSSSQGLVVSVLYCFVNKERPLRGACAGGGGCAHARGTPEAARRGGAAAPGTCPLQLWCPRPFGTYSQNKPCPGPSSTKKPFSCRPTEEPAGARAPSENTPPPPADAAPAPPASAEEGRVLLDTWYVIKPGNTKEKVAFFVAHQCGGGIGGGGTGGRASTMKVKGNWGSDSSKAKRRRRCHDPTKSKPSPAWATGSRDLACPRPGDPSAAAGEAPDLLSVAEMVALVEQRTALALQSFPRPCGAPAAPVVFVEAAGGETKAPSGSDCSRVAEAVAHFESRQREHGGARPNGLCRPGAECTPAAAAASAAPGPGEVRIAFRISSGREPRAGAAAAESGAVGRPNCVFMSCGTASGGSGAGGRAKDKITCDLYQLISPSRDALPNNVEFLLAAAGPKGDGEGPDVDMGCGEGPATAVKPEAGEGTGEGPSASARDCASGFHVDVVVTGVVDQCVFFGKDSAKKMKEETVRLPAAAQEDPPPGQLFLLPVPEETPAAEDAEAGEEPPAVPDPSLCRLYRHVSHDFLEIRFKIQRLLEPRQYMLLLPEHVMVKIFSYLPTQALAALKCSCHYFKSIIETFGVQATDSRWNRDPLYRDDPCKQCKKHYEKGDVSLCRWHPKPYHHDLPYGRSYWMCCRRPDKEAPGCRVGLHDNNWVHPAARRDDGR